MMSDGRRYSVQLETAYLGGALANDAYDALVAALDPELDASLWVSPHAYDVVVLRATVRSGSTLDALTRLTVAWDRALRRTGLFEEFDASGPVLRAAPLEHTGRIYELP